MQMENIVSISFSSACFALFASPAAYRSTSAVLGRWVAKGGCPSTYGLFLHALIFGICFFCIFGTLLFGFAAHFQSPNPPPEEKFLAAHSVQIQTGPTRPEEGKQLTGRNGNHLTAQHEFKRNVNSDGKSTFAQKYYDRDAKRNAWMISS